METLTKSKKAVKKFNATYVFGGDWIGDSLQNAKNVTVQFTLEEIQKYGIANVIKYYAKRYNIGECKYNCFIDNFGKGKDNK